MLIFVEGTTPKNPEKNPGSRDENKQQTQPTYDSGPENLTRATAAGGERSHYCVILASKMLITVITRDAMAGRVQDLADHVLCFVLGQDTLL